MNKNDLVNVVSNTHGFKKKIAASIVDTIFQAISDTVTNGDEMRIAGFGTFKARKYLKYNGRNPATGEERIIPERYLPIFTASKIFKENVKKSLN